MTELERVHVLTGLLESGRYNSHETVYASHDGKNMIVVDIRQPGGNITTLYLKVGEQQ
mgnify:CR=1 FL=1